MIVDDNLDAAQSLAALLKAGDRQVMIMDDAVNALIAATGQPAQVYILDIGLPGMDG